MEPFPSVPQPQADRGRRGRRRPSLGALSGALAAAAALCLLVAVCVLVAFDRAAARRETETQETSAPPSGRLLHAFPLDSTFGRVFVQEWGPRDATPILISHGTGAWSGFWAAIGQDLARTGYRVVAIDLPPFGFSDRDPKARYGRADQAARLVGVLDELDACRGVLLGHSSGAGPVVEALLRYPQRLVGAVLVSPALALPSADEEPPPVSALVELVLGSDTLTRMLTAATLSNPLLTRRFLTSMLERDAAATEEQAEILRRPLRRTGTTPGYADWLPFLLEPDREALSRRADALRSIPRPVGIVFGEADSVVPVAEGRRIAGLLPGATIDVLPGVGHVPHVEAPAETLRALVAQLQRIPPDATAPGAPRRLDLEACRLGSTN
ncbi:MAG: alpha/beta hydrolase [Betaproteobacteria bacterium]|jgi:pimeloyl-ACP methyl ester carboxylesterase|nr:alpha/beta hydrolase [Betaproteobacteria bacterium]